MLARTFGALKRTNVPSSAFHKPLDRCECQQYYPPTPVPNPVSRPGNRARIKSQDAKVSVMWPATKKPRHWRKTLGPIDGLTRQISGSTMGQRLKVSDRQKSFCHDKPGMLNADELLWKGLTAWDIQSVSHQQHALFIKRNTFRNWVFCRAPSVKYFSLNIVEFSVNYL